MKNPARSRWFRAFAIGLAMGGLTWLAYRLPPPSTSDIDQTLAGARAFWSGLDPYAEAGEGKFFYPLLYPFTALLILSPLTVFTDEAARIVFATVSGLAFGLAAFSYGRGLPAALLSASFLHSVILGQWSPLLTAGAVCSPLAFLWAAKPSIGLGLLLAFPSRKAVAGLAVVGVLSLILYPRWIPKWLESLPKGIQSPPVLQPGGVVLLLAFLRWRCREGRLLGALACVPQTITLYETLPLFLIPRDKWEGYVLAALSYVAAYLQTFLYPRLPGMGLEEVLAQRWPVLFACLYVPALVMVLRSGSWPNEFRLRGA